MHNPWQSSILAEALLSVEALFLGDERIFLLPHSNGYSSPFVISVETPLSTETLFSLTFLVGNRLSAQNLFPAKGLLFSLLSGIPYLVKGLLFSVLGGKTCLSMGMFFSFPSCQRLHCRQRYSSHSPDLFRLYSEKAFFSFPFSLKAFLCF